MMERYDVVVIGGGIVGLAVGRELTRRFPRLRSMVLEKEARVGTHQSGHNSGVIHSGVYYKPGSLKARTCVAGAAAMVEFCREHRVPFTICGKVIVATSEAELPAPEVPPTCIITPSSLTPTVAGAAFTVTTKSSVAKTYNFGINGIGTDAAQVAHTAAVTFDSLFTVALSNSSGSQSVLPGQTATYSLIVDPVGATTFQKAVSFTCTGLPAGATCSNPSITVGSSEEQIVSISITTLGPNRALVRPSAANPSPGTPFLLWISGMGIVMGGLVRRPSPRRNGSMVTLIVTVLLILCSCGGSSGGGGGGGGGGGITVSVTPHTSSKFPTEQQQFSAGVTGTSNTQVAWQVNGVTGGNASAGTIDGAGLYTAPGTVPTPANVTVSAVSQADVTKSGTATVSILTPTPSGTYTVTIAATVGSLTKTTTASLVVQ